LAGRLLPSVTAKQYYAVQQGHWQRSALFAIHKRETGNKPIKWLFDTDSFAEDYESWLDRRDRVLPFGRTLRRRGKIGAYFGTRIADLQTAIINLLQWHSLLISA
jgi:hypothetical protein